MNKNILITVLTLALCFTGYFAFQNTQNAINTNITQVGGIDWNKPFEKNLALEDVYNKLNTTISVHTLCIPVKKFHCNANSCRSTEPTVFNLIGGSRQNPTISRCDANGCDTYESVVDDSGEYKNIQPIDPKGFLFKMSYNTIDKKFIEITTLGLDTFISYGYCTYKK